ncbi:torsin-1A-interacting protein 2 isoform X31 [Xyrauchen texanus]|uniref:torsin-1A-interacting protein 2 isoform X29 n=1 Tax=Xyrauchen texanus TaxID=154827 RepID=UPI002241F97C|nr:torsin-1A-interacting protein 2 isoform X29 [Xyrauchen texanus]XP_051950106.1 torsin-1A-interacting protein 2 isoform X30 [Xyrauchen texanus]XP_051950107.1 torsin-1A-interacting protein 2 isoform X31 [Xyrauchen texanus]
MAEIKVDSDRNKDALLTTVQSAEGSSDKKHDSSLTVNEKTEKSPDRLPDSKQHSNLLPSETTTGTEDKTKNIEHRESKERTQETIDTTYPHGDAPHSQTDTRRVDDGEKDNEKGEKKEEKTEKSPDRLPDSKQHSNLLPSETTTGTEDKPKNIEHRESKERTQETIDTTYPHGDAPHSQTDTRRVDDGEKDNEKGEKKEDAKTDSTAIGPSGDSLSSKGIKREDEKTEKSPDRLPDSKQHSNLLPSETTTGTEDKPKNIEHREKRTQETIDTLYQHGDAPHSQTDTRRVDDGEKDNEKGEKKEDANTDSTAIGPSEDEPLNDTVLQQENQTPRTVPKNYKLAWIGVIVALLLSVVCANLYQYNVDLTQPVQKEFNVVELFNKEMEKVKSSFPNQRSELWRRSLIHLRRHLNSTHHTEPVSLILTSGHGAERTLGCLAQHLAKAFSTALNSSYHEIIGKGTASQDSDQVKLDIDSKLREAFEKNTKAAVVHRFEEFPPGSTLIFYRYCDHENAAYKNVFLAFTVMLDAEVEVPANASLGKVEDMVHEQIKERFISSDKSALFNQMDVDKLSGLWSRISHLILPVVAEEKIEQQGCAQG